MHITQKGKFPGMWGGPFLCPSEGCGSEMVYSNNETGHYLSCGRGHRWKWNNHFGDSADAQPAGTGFPMPPISQLRP